MMRTRKEAIEKQERTKRVRRDWQSKRNTGTAKSSQQKRRARERLLKHKTWEAMNEGEFENDYKRMFVG